MAIDPPGTCHLVGCPSKGKHSPHHQLPKIGAPDDFTPYAHTLPSCPGFPEVGVDITDLDATCSIAGVQAWWVHPERPVTPGVMAQLVGQHKRECTNRGPRP